MVLLNPASVISGALGGGARFRKQISEIGIQLVDLSGMSWAKKPFTLRNQNPRAKHPTAKQIAVRVAFGEWQQANKGLHPIERIEKAQRELGDYIRRETATVAGGPYIRKRTCHTLEQLKKMLREKKEVGRPVEMVLTR